jgi:hypothetical protein
MEGLKRWEVVKEMTRLLSDNRIGLAAELVYNEFWHCSVTNRSKQIKEEVQT